MNPWWRRPVAEEGRDETPASGARRSEVEKSTVPAGDEGGEDGGPASIGAVAADASTLEAESDVALDRESSPEGDDVEPKPVEQESTSAAESAAEQAADEPPVSAALEAATEPAAPVRSGGSGSGDGAPPKRRRRRRRRRGGRGGQSIAEGSGDRADAVSGQDAPPASRTGRAGAAAHPRFGRTAVLLDLGALERSLGDGASPVLDDLFARLSDEFGKLVLRRVYASVGDGRLDRSALHTSGAEVVDVPIPGEERGCPAAVRIVIDALEMCYTKRSVNTLAVAATSPQLLPLIAKLQQNGVTVIGLGGPDGDPQVRAQCDRFIDLQPEMQSAGG